MHFVVHLLRLEANSRPRPVHAVRRSFNDPYLIGPIISPIACALGAACSYDEQDVRIGVQEPGCSPHRTRSASSVGSTGPACRVEHHANRDLRLVPRHLGSPDATLLVRRRCYRCRLVAPSYPCAKRVCSEEFGSRASNVFMP